MDRDMQALYYAERTRPAVDLELLQQRLNGVMVTDEGIEREREWRANNCLF